jgi:peptidoglycan/xylan/chitin deacetylase (PgdA/CDA1 family)
MSIADQAGWPSAPAQAPWLPILMYHRITPARVANDPYGNCVSVASFESHLRWLRLRGYQSVDLGWVGRLLDGEAASMLPRRPFAITFDDGYLDNQEYALPLLERYGFRATIFVVTSTIGGTNTFDSPAAEDAVKMLSADDIRRLRARGIGIGSHTHSHPQNLAWLTDRELGFELAHSRGVLSDLLQEDIEHFAYPHSALDLRVEAEVARAGYRTACAGRGTSFTRFRLQRVPADSRSGPQLDLYCGWRRLKWRVRALEGSRARSAAMDRTA